MHGVTIQVQHDVICLRNEPIFAEHYVSG